MRQGLWTRLAPPPARLPTWVNPLTPPSPPSDGAGQRVVPFLNQPLAADYFTGIGSWSSSQVLSYVQGPLIRRGAFNLAFLGFALLLLLLFLLWWVEV